MSKKKLSFAIFGNDRQALETVHIWEVLDYLAKREAEIYMEEGFYNDLCKDLNEDIHVSGVFDGANFNTDYAISLGGDGTFCVLPAKWEQNKFLLSESIWGV